MCVIEWGLVAAWVGAVSTAGLFYAAVRGLREWKSQFLGKRDHDLAVRVLRSLTKSYAAFDELRTPHSLISDDIAPAADRHGLDQDFEHREMAARYRSRIRHMLNVVNERITLVDEAMVLWDDDSYGTTLGTLVGRLGQIESNVRREVSRFVESLRPDLPDDGTEIDREILYSPLDYREPDPPADLYEEAKAAVVEHLTPKLRMIKIQKK